MRDSVDKDALIQHLDRIRVPAVFLKAKDIVRQKLSDDVEFLQTKREELETRSSVDLPRKTKKIFALMDFLPKKIEPMGEKYDLLCELLSANGIVDKLFESLESINNSRKNQIFSKDKWRKSLYLTRQVAEEVGVIIDHLYKSYYTNDEITFRQHIAAFDIKVRQLDRYDPVEDFIESMDDVEEVIGDEEIARVYNSINVAKKSVDKLMISISTQKHVDHLVDKLKTEMVNISEERKAISLKIMNIDKPLEETRVVLDDGLYLLEVFWKISLLDYDSFGPKLKALLKTEVFEAWNDARKRYAVLHKIKATTNAFNSVFEVLNESYDQALTNYRKAKRNYHRYKDASSQRGLEAATMHDVQIAEIANVCLGQFVMLCDNLKDISIYVDDTNKFYKENLKLATELYANVKLGLKEWGKIFKDMYKK